MRNSKCHVNKRGENKEQETSSLSPSPSPLCDRENSCLRVYQSGQGDQSPQFRSLNPGASCALRWVKLSSMNFLIRHCKVLSLTLVTLCPPLTCANVYYNIPSHSLDSLCALDLRSIFTLASLPHVWIWLAKIHTQLPVCIMRLVKTSSQ